MKYGESTFDLLYLAFASDAWNADASEDGMLYDTDMRVFKIFKPKRIIRRIRK